MTLLGTPVLCAATIASINQNNAAWHLLNAEELLQPAPDKGDNLDRPTVDGKLGRDFLRDEQGVELKYLFTGNNAPDGDPHTDAIIGLRLNQRAFWNDVFRATRDAYGAVQAEVTDLDGAEFAGRIQLRRLRFSPEIIECTAVMSVIILDGELVETGS